MRERERERERGLEKDNTQADRGKRGEGGGGGGGQFGHEWKTRRCKVLDSRQVVFNVFTVCPHSAHRLVGRAK